MEVSKELHSKKSTYMTIALIGFMLALTGIELDIFLPTLSMMQVDLGTSESEITWVVTINLIGFALSSLFYGSLSDSIGRRPTILIGFSLFTLGSLGCYLSPDFYSFLFARFLQGVGCGAPMTVCFAIVLDLYEKKESASSTISLLNSIITSATMLAPIVGAFIGEYISWRANFALMAIGVTAALGFSWFFLEETLPASQKRQWNFQKTLESYLLVMSKKQAWRLGLIPILMYSALLVYLVNFPLVAYLTIKSITLIGYLQSCIMGSFVVGSLATSYLIPRLKHSFFVSIAYLFACVGGVLLLIGSFYIPQSWDILTVFSGMIAAGTAFVLGMYVGKSLDVCPEIRGVTTAFQGFLRLSISSLVVMISSLIVGDQFIHISFLICLCIFGSLFLCIRDLQSST